MIIYNVKRRWFPMKGDAEAYRVEQKLPPSATFKLDVSDREGLALLLNLLCEPIPQEVGHWPAPPPEVIERAQVDWDAEVKDIVPLFLRKQHALREGLPVPTE